MLRNRSFVVSLVRVREALRRSLSVCQSSCSCVEGRVSRWHSQDRQEPTTNCPLSLLPSHPASVLPFWTIWGAFPQAAMCFQSEANYSPPLVLFPAEKKKQKTGNCLYFTGSIFPISLLSAPSRPEPSGRHIMCLNAACAYVSVFVSLWTDVCVYN